MGEQELQWALRGAGVEGNLSIALAADLAEARDSDIGAAHEASPHAQAGGYREGWATDRADLEDRWDMPPLVADADLCGGFGDLCGRRVA